MNETWNLDELFSFIILQEEDSKTVIQAEVTRAGEFAMPVSIHENIEPAFTIFPNPVNDILHFSLSGNEKTNVKIYDSRGKLQIHTGLNQNNEIDMNTLLTGLYIIAVEQKEIRFQQKVLKQ